MTATIRRTQAERTAQTTARLLEATVSALAELGYQGASTTEIAQRAGVSRGALLHHFPTRAELWVATGEWLVERHIEQFRTAMSAISDESHRIDAAVDLLWQICSSDQHQAWFELSIGARHEPELAATITTLAGHIRDRVRQTWAATFPELQGRPLATVAPDFALSLLEGQAAHQLINPDPPAAAAVISALKELAALHLVDTETP